MTKLGISNKKSGKHNLEYFQILENDKSDGNQYLKNICLTELGISNKKCGKHNLKYLQFTEIWKNDRSGGNQTKSSKKLKELRQINNNSTVSYTV